MKSVDRLVAEQASESRAQALEEIAGERIAEGLAIVKDGHAVPLTRFQLREVAVHGRPTRVAEYEQPVFAWK